jgi:Predicted periplasmic solute-binding protein
VNMAPVFYRLEAEVEEIVGVPTDLNRRSSPGEIDVAPISSIAYARNARSCACCRASACRAKAQSSRSS